MPFWSKLMSARLLPKKHVDQVGLPLRNISQVGGHGSKEGLINWRRKYSCTRPRRRRLGSGGSCSRKGGSAEGWTLLQNCLGVLAGGDSRTKAGKPNPEAALEGKTLSGDALYSNKNLVREIVQERGGEVLVQLKANQKTTLEEATRRLNQSAPPFYTQTQNSATDA